MKKLVVLTGAGMSAESGFETFRDAGGLWEQYPVEKVATPEGWMADPDLVTDFYNGLRRQLAEAAPNEGHRLLAEMEREFDVTVVTQNVDDLHERAGSDRVIHLHGELMKVCSSRDPENPFFAAAPVDRVVRRGRSPSGRRGTGRRDGRRVRYHRVVAQRLPCRRTGELRPTPMPCLPHRPQGGKGSLRPPRGGYPRGCLKRCAHPLAAPPHSLTTACSNPFIPETTCLI